MPKQIVKDRVQCGCCGGKGSVPLSPAYQQTMNGVRRRCKTPQDYVVANRDHYWFDCNACALNNRLAKLEEHGLLTSVRVGKQRRFRPV